MTERVLVTGASGFIGSHLVRALADRGAQVSAMMRSGSDPRNIAGVPCQFVEADLTDPPSLRDAVDQCETVFHCAAVISFDQRDAQAMWQINVEGTRALVRAALDARVKRFVLTSSVSAIGFDRRGRVLDETAPYNFAALDLPYCDTKHAAEQVLLTEGVAKGLDGLIVNPATVFGPGDRRKTRGSILERLATAPPLFAPPGGLNAVDVQDVVSGHLLAAQRGRTGHRYILGGENLTHFALMSKVCRIIKKRPPAFVIPRPLMRLAAFLANLIDAFYPLRPPLTAGVFRLMPYRLFYSSEKAARELDYAAYPIDMSIKSAFDWMLDLDLLPAGTLRGVGRY
jgi:dihydroflavonol-4-reductase